ncbi:regulator of Vps4 activity in the MVB pathway-domain-containing protein [Schizophyllum amplum]|uniref:Regulator of Vps4 activity in the MVB pathway-domain-containing protein n=1 Tax=Schizophyllum amplum TaxID=97359 RepID=A0A550CAQ5_9AGAR|nr:regulator of Vps4 activity in the MVB pathway-domain-containing protein [Auriculariopsis ampla]
MSSARWDPAAVKAQLRLTSQRIGQLLERQDSKSQITRRDIATLLQQGNVMLARAKAQKLIHEDLSGDVLEMLEMCIGVLVEHFSELSDPDSLPPIVIEAVSSIIYAAPSTDSKELNTVRSMLIEHLGPSFARSAIGNRDGYVSDKVINALSAPPPSAANLDAYLVHVARTYGVDWTPAPRRQQILSPLAEILDPEATPLVDLPRLRQLCALGIPDEPSWLRPRIWKLFFGILPVLKASWQGDIKKQRDSYYDLVKRLLEPLTALPPPTLPLAGTDQVAHRVSQGLSRVPSSLLSELEEEPEPLPFSPLDDAAADDIRLSCAHNLDDRLKLITDARNPLATGPTPEIRLDDDSTPTIQLSEPADETPSIQLSSPVDDNGAGAAALALAPGKKKPTTLHPSRAYGSLNVSPKHESALRRLLYLHSSINPGNLSPHISSLLVPLYTVMNREIQLEDMAHVEADTFWLFEAMLADFAELEDEEGGAIWMKKFSERLTWADYELSENMVAKGLDPALPHYSYRWLAPLLTQTLPLSSVFLVWDVLFSKPQATRDGSPKLETLIDVCTAMLIRARPQIFRLGKGGAKSPSLWAQDAEALPPPSPLRSWELGDAFLEGMSLLQFYPVEVVGGIDTVLQAAMDLVERRNLEARQQQPNPQSLTSRLANTMWRGLTNQQYTPEASPENSDTEDSPKEKPSTPQPTAIKPIEQTPIHNKLGARLSNAVWRGITNQSAMDAPPSPLDTSPVHEMPISLPPRPSDVDEDAAGSSAASAASLWSYAEKLKQSDAAARFSKVSSNWRARAMLGSWGGGLSPSTSIPDEVDHLHRNSTMSEGFDYQPPNLLEARRDSLPAPDRTGIYSPPARPAFFRPPRDSGFFSPVRDKSSSPTESSPKSENGIFSKALNVQDALAHLTRATTPQPAPRPQPSPTPKSGPRPLLLGSTPVTSRPLSRHISKNSGQYEDLSRRAGRPTHRPSQSSLSTVPDIGRRSEPESDGGSRIVPINRRSVSPMAPTFRRHSRTPSRLSEAQSPSPRSSTGGLLSPPSSTATLDSRGWGKVDNDSPPMTSPKTPDNVSSDNEVRVDGVEQQRGSIVIPEVVTSPLEAPAHAKKLTRKKTPPPVYNGDTSDSSASMAESGISVPGRQQRVRARRGQRPANLRLHERRTPSPKGLAVDWPGEEELAATPKATQFEGEEHLARDQTPSRQRKISDSQESTRARKVSTSSRSSKRRVRESAAEEGDDEGYDDFLSAYESEEGATPGASAR